MPAIYLLCCPVLLITVDVMAYCKRHQSALNSPVPQSQTSVVNLPGSSVWTTDSQSSRAAGKDKGPQADPVSMVLSKII